MSNQRGGVIFWMLFTIVACGLYLTGLVNLEPALEKWAESNYVGAVKEFGAAHTRSVQQVADLYQCYWAAAKIGRVEAQQALGLFYENGIGVPKDLARAFQLYRSAAESGSAQAQYHLGLMHMLGQGAPYSAAGAAVWYEKAAQQGLSVAQLQIGLAYVNGFGVDRSFEKGYFWLALAAKKGEACAIDMLPLLERQLTPEQKQKLSVEIERWRPV